MDFLLARIASESLSATGVLRPPILRLDDTSPTIIPLGHGYFPAFVLSSFDPRTGVPASFFSFLFSSFRGVLQLYIVY